MTHAPLTPTRTNWLHAARLPVAQPERLIQPPAGGDAGVLLRRHVQQIVANIGLDGVDGGVAQQHKGGDGYQTEQPCQTQQGFQTCANQRGRT